MKNEYSINKEIRKLKGVRGYGTELISVYIPAGYQLSDETAKLREEYSQSSNIKSKSVRLNVQSALDKIIQYLKLFRETPQNGIAIFAGNVSDNPGRSEIGLFSMEPPSPLKVNIYRCDSTFLLEPLEAMMSNKDVYVLVVMDGREATIASLKGHHIQVIKKLNSMVHAKVRKGGQSAARYSRGIEESIGEYHMRVAEVINSYCEQNSFKPKGVIIGGPGPTKEGFAKADKLNYQIKVLGVYDTGYTDEFGLHELVEKANDLLKEQEAAQERTIIERFIKETAVNGLAVHGYAATKEALEADRVSKLIISESLEITRVTYKCTSDGTMFEAVELGKERQQKHNCGSKLEIAKEEDAIEELIEMADHTGTDTVFVSEESSYGKQFMMGFGGIGALLRYK